MIRLIFILCFIFISCNHDKEDCMGVSGGAAFTDDCGQCVGGTSGLVENYLMDDCGECGGEGIDIDQDGICDDEDECIGAYDECGECNGPGMDEGACDCEGNILDECGECGGDGIIECWNGWEVCNIDDCPTYNSLDIYDLWKQLTDLEPDDNGYYHFSYEPTGNYSESDYGTVKYFTELPTTRVFWNSPDSFWVYHQGQWIGEPIICCSTYSGSDGYGQQLFYIYEPHIGDTLSIYGHVCEDTNFGDCPGNPLVMDSIFVIIED